MFDSTNNKLNVSSGESSQRVSPVVYHEFFTTSTFSPFLNAAVVSGTVGTGNGTADHPGIIRLNCSTSANSGYYIGSHSNSLLLGGSEEANIIFNIQTTTNTTIRLGFHTSTSSADAADGVYLEINGTTATGKTANNSSRSSTGTTGTLTISTWYRARISMNSNATIATFTVYDDSGTVVWTDTLATNIPTARNTGIAICATNSGSGSALVLVDLDYMGISFGTLTRGGI